MGANLSIGFKIKGGVMENYEKFSKKVAPSITLQTEQSLRTFMDHNHAGLQQQISSSNGNMNDGAPQEDAKDISDQ